MQITHNQHYVWRKYLKPWCTGTKNNFIWWNNHKIVNYTKSFDILREKDFYKYKPLNELELFTVKKMFFETENDTKKKMNQYVEMITDIFGDEKRMSDDVRVEAGEMIQSEIEKNGSKYLDCILNDDIRFMLDDDKMTFLMFVLFQYFRTKAIRDKIILKMSNKSAKLIELYKKEFDAKEELSVDWGNIYNYGYIALINNVVTSLGPSIKIRILKSNKARFITCDQPVFNLSNEYDKDVCFFYPLGPNHSIMLSNKFDDNEILDINDSEVLKYNMEIIKHSHEFILGKEKVDVNFSY